jgi:hypothetical protein
MVRNWNALLCLCFRLPTVLHQQTISTSWGGRLLSHFASLWSSWLQNPCWDIQKPGPVLTWWQKIQNFWGNCSHTRVKKKVTSVFLTSFMWIYSIWWSLSLYYRNFFVLEKKKAGKSHIFQMHFLWFHIHWWPLCSSIADRRYIAASDTLCSHK